MSDIMALQKHFDVGFWLFITLSSIFQLSLSDCAISEYTDDDSVRAEEKKLMKTIEPLKGHVFKAKNGSYEYEVRICDTVQGQESGVGAVQHISGGKDKVIGRTDSADIFGGGGWIVLTYHNGTKYGNHCAHTDRKSQIMIMCDPKNVVGEFKHLIEKRRNSSNCFYLFELRSKVACIGGTSKEENANEGLSSGSVFCILFFTFFGMYIILGFLYKRIVVGAKGLEQIPNYSFWREFGNLQADACDFVCRCGPRQESHAYRGIDDRLKDTEERDEQLLN